MDKIKVTFFSAKDYDKESFEKAELRDMVDITYLETRLSPDTYKLAEGSDVVCVFVNDDLNAFVIDKLY